MSPTLIITCGPTASGKSSLPKKVKQLLKIEGNFDSFLIDDLVEKTNPYYKGEVKKFIQTQQKVKTTKEIMDMFLNPSKKMISKFNEYYWNARKKTNCETGEKLSSDLQSNCDNLNDSLLEKAFNTGKNIVFELRGVAWPDWLFDLFKNQLKKHNYTIIVAWTVVDMCELIDRNKRRAIKSVGEFLRDKCENSPPRLPDIRLDAYADNLKNIINTFKQQVLIQLDCKKDCKRLLVFDNNEVSKLLYDSQSKDSSIVKAKSAIDTYDVNKDCVLSKPAWPAVVEKTISSFHNGRLTRNNRGKKKRRKNKRNTKKLTKRIN